MTLVLALLAASSLATPQKGEGDIAVLGGYRLVPTGSLALEAERAGDPLVDRGGRAPAALAIFSYHLDGAIVAAIEIGLTADALKLQSGEKVSWSTVTIQFAGQYELRPLKWLAPFVGAGFGYYLNSVRRTAPEQPAYSELNATGFYASIGLRAAIWGPLGFYLEDRYAFASFALPKVGRPSVGGNTVSAGFFLTMEAEEERHASAK